MVIPDIVWLILYIFMSAQVLIWILWRISCFFKKTCHWKSCPYHQQYFNSQNLSLLCKKFPPTQKEIDEHNKKLDELLEQLSKK